ncbi:MAG TPA: pilus assembly protein TadG-related protein, partial [Candidatus Limnocylindria bacterium]|nr:pilus assembly protein TadG-related protein [Candidatus Limnocylindria bacterium]
MTRIRARIGRVLAEREAGYVAVFIALCLPLLVGMCALAVDVATWQVTGTKLQKAADSAALAGTIYLPASQATAFSTATDLARVNGYSAADGDVITAARTDRPTQLRVTITTTVNNAFGVIFGREQTRVTRTSVADYAGPIPMGSPCNVFGNEEMEAATGNQVGSSDCDGQAGTYWMNIAGTNVNKARGDGYSAGYCTKPDGTTIDECTSVGASSPTGPPTNKDYIADPNLGYLYGVRVTQAGINLKIQGYDLSWAAQGDACTDSTLNNATTARNPWVTDEATRYVKNKGPFCAGDTAMNTPEGDGTSSKPASKVRTIVNVYEPSLTPWNPLNAPLLCTLDLPGWDSTTQLSTVLNAGSPNYSSQLAEHFRRW